MASRSSSDHPESSHPYHADRSCSTTSLESQGRSGVGTFGSASTKSRREDLLPLRLSSSSPPQLLPLTPLQSIHLPHPASMDTTGITAGDSTWAATYESPPPPTHDHTWDANPPAPSAPVSPSEFWDNITIPLSAYIPAPCDGSPEHRTPPPSTSTLQHRGAPPIWDQPVQTNERPLKSIPSVEEPVASTSRLPAPDSNDSSYWSNAIEQRPGRRAQIHHKQWGRIDRQLRSEPQPPPELLAPPESRYYEYFTDEDHRRGYPPGAPQST